MRGVFVFGEFMQISVDSKYPGHVLNTHRVQIELDGVKQHLCVAADEEAGTVTRFVVDTTGNIALDPLNPTEALIETVKGEVKILLPEHWTPMYPAHYERM